MGTRTCRFLRATKWIGKESPVDHTQYVGQKELCIYSAKDTHTTPCCRLLTYNIPYDRGGIRKGKMRSPVQLMYNSSAVHAQIQVDLPGPRGTVFCCSVPPRARPVVLSTSSVVHPDWTAGYRMNERKMCRQRGEERRGEEEDGMARACQRRVMPFRTIAILADDENIKNRYVHVSTIRYHSRVDPFRFTSPNSNKQIYLYRSWSSSAGI